MADHIPFLSPIAFDVVATLPLTPQKGWGVVDNTTGHLFVYDGTQWIDHGFIGVSNSRQVIAGAGLAGGGDLSADRTLDVVANVDGSIVVNANDIQVGTLATDTQHGNRGGGALHAIATLSTAGFMSPAQVAQLDASTPYVWKATGNLILFPTDSTAPTQSGGIAAFDGLQILPISKTVNLFRLIRRVAGSAGTTTVEVWTKPSQVGAWTLQATLSLLFSTGDAANTTVTPGAPLTLLAGTYIMVRFTSLESGLLTPMDVTVTVEWQ